MPTASGSPFATDGKIAVAAYYSGAKSVDVATFDGSTWSTTTVADAADPDPSAAGNLAPITAAGDRHGRHGLRRVGRQRAPSFVGHRLVLAGRPRAHDLDWRRPFAGVVRQRHRPQLVRDPAAEPDGRLPRRSAGRPRRPAEPLAHGVARPERRGVRRQDRGARRGREEPRLRERLSGGARRASRSRSPSTTRTPASSTTSRSSRTPRPADNLFQGELVTGVKTAPTTCRRSTPGRTSSTATCTRP